MKRGIKALVGSCLGAAVILLVLTAAFAVSFLIFRVQRPPAAPDGVAVSMPWGAIDTQEMALDAEVGLQASIAESLRSETPAEFDRDEDGIREYALLALSGGGSNGAYGAGMLCGWTKHGDRPDFKVVTGVSTGALQAIPAFLGSNSDGVLKTIFTSYDSSQIYTKRSYLNMLMGYSVFDTAPLKALIDGYIDADVVKDIAAKHRRGYRLFVGTTNMDTSELVIWDIGAIASSGRPEAIEHIRRILLASCAIPVVFPPVYFKVEAGGKTYYEMHTDGGLNASVFLRGFMLDLDDAFKDAGIDREKTEFSLYVIRNGVIGEHAWRNAVDPYTLSIAAASVRELVRIGTTASFFRVYALSKIYGVPFFYSSIPDSYDGNTDMIVFDPKMMQKLFQCGFDRVMKDDAWSSAPPGIDWDEEASIAGQHRVASTTSN